ncbi:MAG: hypothetical protein QGF36_05650 [Candidatus Marinimicrobia bacterium]|jgi:hypothetical protein|nr:hypothetical protein [Candidatus Neomarinimicrobiota bacterium]MDP6853324.1 hypothetical protein [Candidatus Neomarinimicrobiota bacterium]MDP6936900.1 hypothetical protein [Candidatus Neomarinimicrobiota bacterium]
MTVKPLRRKPFTLTLIILLYSCGGDSVEDIIDTYQGGNKKVFVRYHSDESVLEKHFYNNAGEMVYVERDSLSKSFDFQNFLQGSWIMERMTVNDEIVFEKDSVYNPENPPNVYLFSRKKLLVSGPQYSADYSIQYLDSSQIEMEGRWSYGVEGDVNFRSQRVNFDIDYLQVLSYYSFQWTEFLEDPEKEEEVIFTRLIIPPVIEEPDTFITPISDIE